MATQKQVTELLKVWQEAASFKEATEAASQTAEEFNGLYEESAKNLLARQPDLMLLLSAYQAGRMSVKPVEPVQEGLQLEESHG